jgi:hypothetical protein
MPSTPPYIFPAQNLDSPVVRGRIELPTFRFSGLRITVQGRPRRSPWLVSSWWYTLMDAGVRGCMRLRMRLPVAHTREAGRPAGKEWCRRLHTTRSPTGMSTSSSAMALPAVTSHAIGFADH